MVFDAIPHDSQTRARSGRDRGVVGYGIHAKGWPHSDPKTTSSQSAQPSSYQVRGRAFILGQAGNSTRSIITFQSSRRATAALAPISIRLPLRGSRRWRSASVAGHGARWIASQKAASDGSQAAVEVDFPTGCFLRRVRSFARLSRSRPATLESFHRATLASKRLIATWLQKVSTQRACGSRREPFMRSDVRLTNPPLR